jgi:hypothetical protein
MACEEFRDRMLDVLYGEGEPAGMGELEAHQQECAECRDELRALRGLRRDLRAWTVPALPRAARRAVLGAPAWLPVAAGLALAVAGAAALVSAHSRAEAVRTELARHEDRHRAEMAALQQRMAAAPPAGEATLEDVRRLIRESEARQTLVLDASVRALAERTDAQRREDLAQVSAGFDYIEGRTGLQVARTTELMGHVLQASQRK